MKRLSKPPKASRTPLRPERIQLGIADLEQRFPLWRLNPRLATLNRTFEAPALDEALVLADFVMHFAARHQIWPHLHISFQRVIVIVSGLDGGFRPGDLALIEALDAAVMEASLPESLPEPSGRRGAGGST